jgi:hypothetical protein
MSARAIWLIGSKRGRGKSQQSMTLVTNGYRLTGNFPKDARYELTSQIRRAVIAIPSNIAEEFSWSLRFA